MLPRMMWAKHRLARRALLDAAPEDGYGTASSTEKSPSGPTTSPRRTFTGTLPESWMGELNDGLPLSAVTIPGTHDSAAFTYSWPFVATQNMNIAEQLNAGIRYFDLRCGVRSDIVEMVHGQAYLGLRLEEVLQAMYDWLAQHETEGLVVQIKRDRNENNSTMEFAHAIASIIRKKSPRWRTSNTTPSVGELRGRIQLFRRFYGPSLYAYGIDVSRWEDNPRDPFTIYTSHGTQITIQDHYSWPGPKALPGLIAEKGGDVAGLLNKAADDLDVHHWYINFTSAYEFNLYYQIPPREIALGGYWAFKWEEGMNIRLRTFLSQKFRRRRYGIVAMDFPEAGADDLILEVIMSNFEREESEIWDTLCFWLPMLLVLVTVTVIVVVLLPGTS